MPANMIAQLWKKIPLRELVAFGFVGGLATLTHYTCAIVSHELMLLELYLANLVGYLCAVAVSFIGHSKLTFQKDMNRAQLQRFCLMSVTTFALSEALLWLLESILLMQPRIVMMIVVVSIPAISYLLNKFWVYR